jgi:hypothetical protein
MAAELVGVAVGSPTLFLRRLRLANGVPLGVLENTLPEQFTGIDTETFTRHGLYQVLRKTRTAWSAFGSQQSEPYRWGHAYLDGYPAPAGRPLPTLRSSPIPRFGAFSHRRRYTSQQHAAGRFRASLTRNLRGPVRLLYRAPEACAVRALTGSPDWLHRSADRAQGWSARSA